MPTNVLLIDQLFIQTWGRIDLVANRSANVGKAAMAEPGTGNLHCRGNLISYPMVT